MNRRERRAAQTKKVRLAHSLQRTQSKIVNLESSVAKLRTDFDAAIDEILEFAATEIRAGSTELGDKEIGDLAVNALDRIVNEELRGFVVHHAWHDATAETVDDLLVQEISDRAQLRRDLVLALATIDKMAFAAIKGAPATPEAVFGVDNPDALQDLFWRLADRGWRSTTRENVFQRLTDFASERAEFVSKSSRLETVILSETRKYSKREQQEAEERWQVMMEKDYAAIKRPGVLQYIESEIAKAIADVDGRDPELARRMRALDTTMTTLIHGPPPTSKPFVISSARFEADLMRVGSFLWERSFKIGEHPEAAARKEAERTLLATVDKKVTPQETRLSIAETVQNFFEFAATWAVQAFQKIVTTHTFAAALMCSDPDGETLEMIENQWQAFMVVVPNGMLRTSDGTEVTRLLVHRDEIYGCAITFVDSASSKVYGQTRGASTLAELLSYDDTATEHSRLGMMGCRLVSGLLLSMQEKTNFTDRIVPRRVGRPGRGEDEPSHRIVSVGRSLTVDCREAVVQFIKIGKSSKRGLRKNGPPTVQTLVRGHYKRQVCGIGRLQRKIIWIEPFWRGPEDAPILTRPKAIQ